VNDVVVLGVKALNGGLFVTAFAFVAEVLEPKRFAGLFAAAPSVALANLLVVAFAKGRTDAVANSAGMLIGAGAFAAAAIVGVRLCARRGARVGSLTVCGVWLLLAPAAYMVLA
jgi:hypothetical protein